MQAVHSSSALAVNAFQYWQKVGLVPEIAAACGFCKRDAKISEKIIFEDRSYAIDSNDLNFPIPPNIDVVIHNGNSAVC
jgi:hypothetical protein